jgi:hypothetical protein
MRARRPWSTASLHACATAMWLCASRYAHAEHSNGLHFRVPLTLPRGQAAFAITELTAIKSFGELFKQVVPLLIDIFFGLYDEIGNDEVRLHLLPGPLADVPPRRLCWC